MVGDRGVRLRIGAMQLVRRQLRKDNRRRVCISQLRSRGILSRRRGRRVEAPLKEVDISAGLGGGLRLAFLVRWFFLRLRARQRQDELGVLTGCCCNSLV